MCLKNFVFFLTPFLFFLQPVFASSNAFSFQDSSIHRVDQVTSVEDVQRRVREAATHDEVIVIRHGQYRLVSSPQGSRRILLNLRKLNRVVNVDLEEGWIEVEAGITFPELYAASVENHLTTWTSWGLHQRHLGVDEVTLEEAIAINAHGHVLGEKPLIDDIEFIELVNAKGELVRCSREENAKLFRLVMGGHGLFGIVVRARLKLIARHKVMRTVQEIYLGKILEEVEDAMVEGSRYGDFRFFLDPKSEDFMRKGILSFYRSVEPTRPLSVAIEDLTARDWREFYSLMRTDPKAAYEYYSTRYLVTHSRVDWIDDHPVSQVQNVRKDIESKVEGQEKMIELYVPRENLVIFIEDLREYVLSNHLKLMDATIRFLDKRSESFLSSNDPETAAIFLIFHVDQTRQATRVTENSFRELINLVLAYQGSYFLGYHRYAVKPQVEAAYPQFMEFIKKKRLYDPEERFQSEWYRHYRNTFMRTP